MRLLVLGASGQLGSDLVETGTEAEKHDIRPLTRADIDLANTESIAPVLDAYDFDTLINCAACNRVDDIERQCEDAFRGNALAVREMGDVCRRKDAWLIHVSTDYVFNGQANCPYRKEDSPGPLNAYGASKLMGEKLARSVHDRVIDDQVMSPTASADVARVILKCLGANLPAGIYHAVNGGQALWYEFARRIIETAGICAEVRPIPALEYHQLAQRPVYSVLDNTKLTSIVGPMPHWSDSLERYMRQKVHL